MEEQPPMQAPPSKNIKMIKKEGKKYVVRSHSGRNLGKYRTKAGAKKRIRQVEYFKHKKK